MVAPHSPDIDEREIRHRLRGRVAGRQAYLAETDRADASPSSQAQEEASSFIERETRAVILGDPGTGKTTFARRTAHDLARRVLNRLGDFMAGKSDAPLLPILARVAAYAEALGTQKGLPLRLHLQRHVETSVANALSSRLWVLMEKVLDEGRCWVMLDGLDEVSEPIESEEQAETTMAHRVAGQIQEFAPRGWPGKVVVTSRIKGYIFSPFGSLSSSAESSP